MKKYRNGSMGHLYFKARSATRDAFAISTLQRTMNTLLGIRVVSRFFFMSIWDATWCADSVVWKGKPRSRLL